MRYWEFLIQQEGDQTWLPLETRQVEILEGRYRMAAHTSYDDASVEVRVSQLLLDEMPPRRRVRKRKANTNDAGLLAIFPFMQLSPGHWEIHCSSPDVMDDFLGESWQYSVQLQVTPREDDEWNPSWRRRPTAEELPEEISQEPLTLEAGGPSLPKTDEASKPDIETGETEIQLKQQAYVTQPGQVLTLAGKLTGKASAQNNLWVELRDPQAASTLQEMTFTINPGAPFAVTINVPEQLSTQVVLGAVSVRDQGGDSLASASFTVTVGLAQLLDAIANQSELEFEEEISIFPGTTESLVPSVEKAATLLDDDIPLVPKEIIPSEGLTLPPQLKSPGPLDSEQTLEPELPDFAKAAPEATAPSEHPAPNPADSEILDDNDPAPVLEDIEQQLAADRSAARAAGPPPAATDGDVSRGPAPRENISEPAPDQGATSLGFEQGSIEGSIKDDDLDYELVNAALNDPSSMDNFLTADRSADDRSAADPAAEIDVAFQQLRLQERFWEKLNLFTQEGYRQAIEVKRALDVSGPMAGPMSEGNPQSNEFVVEAPQGQSQQYLADSSPREEEEPIQVPAPELDIPQQELISGEWIAIRVRLPVSHGQAYVKVWMNDLQTRTLIESPRLLMQFTPNPDNQLETLMRVKIPTGCLELQFAAIAIDMATLQESRKVTQNRRVMPPEESLSIFDDLNF